MQSSENKEIVDLHVLVRTIFEHWRRFAIVLPLVFVLSYLFIRQVPRYYECKVELSPELSNSSPGGLKSIMSSVGLGGLAGAETDAIYPYIYPDVIASAEFCQSMFDVKVQTRDGNLKTDYRNYLLHHQDAPFWEPWIRNLKKNILPSSSSAPAPSSSGQDNDHIIRLSMEDNNLVQDISNKIDCTVDKKTEVIFIKVTDQDPLVCAAIADTVMTRLQNFILNYRTKKARNDLAYSEKIYTSAKAEYEDAHTRYMNYMDSHRNVTSPAAATLGQKLESEMNLKLSTLSAVTEQYQLARAKVQENTPAFTVVQGPAVPMLPAGPHRLLFVLAMLVLAFMGTTFSLFWRRFWALVD